MENTTGYRGAVPGGAARLQVRGGVGQPRPQRGHAPGRHRQADQAQGGGAGQLPHRLQVINRASNEGSRRLKFYNHGEGSYFGTVG